jgi:uncharacterized protein YggE
LTQSFSIVFAAVAGTIIIGCAAPQTQELKRAREIFTEAQKDSTLTPNASVTLTEAGRNLNRALKSTSRKEQRHLAYLARKRIELARLQVLHMQKEIELQALQERQEQYLFTLRRLHHERAERQAEQAQRELDSHRSEELQQAGNTGKNGS